MNLSGNSISKVYRDGPWIIKEQPLHLCDNEWRGLSLMAPFGFAPPAIRVDELTIKMRFLESDERLESAGKFVAGCKTFLLSMESVGLIHGDLTEPHVFVVNNMPMVIDWAESRVVPEIKKCIAPPKRREGDLFWMQKTSEKILKRYGIELRAWTLGTNAVL